MRELDKEEKNPRYIAFIAVVGIAFFNFSFKTIHITSLECGGVRGESFTK